MPLDPHRIFTLPERAAYRLRCPECRSPVAVTWRRAHQPGRSEDLFTVTKTSCPNRCDFDRRDLSEER